MTNVQRPLREQVIYRFAYAVALFHGAESTCKLGEADPAIYAWPTFLLLGFSLENAFASFLIACEHKNYRDYKSGHDLDAALSACRQYDLVLSPDNNSFVNRLAPYHRDFIFRYPEKAQSEFADLNDFLSSLRAARSIIEDIELMLKIRGFDLDATAKTLPS